MKFACWTDVKVVVLVETSNCKLVVSRVRGARRCAHFEVRERTIREQFAVEGVLIFLALHLGPVMKECKYEDSKNVVKVGASCRAPDKMAVSWIAPRRVVMTRTDRHL